MDSEFPDRIPWERQYYCDITIPRCPKSIKCKTCGTAFLDEKKYIPFHIKHLKERHNTTELTHHPKNEFLKEYFIINEENFTAKCRFECCKHFLIDYNKYGLYLLINHFEIYHGNDSYIYERITRTEIGCDTLNKYFIMNGEATCTKCDEMINMSGADLYIISEIKLEELLERYFSHRYENTCFIFAKTRKNRFCFTSFIPIISY